MDIGFGSKANKMVVGNKMKASRVIPLTKNEMAKIQDSYLFNNKLKKFGVQLFFGCIIAIVVLFIFLFAGGSGNSGFKGMSGEVMYAFKVIKLMGLAMTINTLSVGLIIYSAFQVNRYSPVEEDKLSIEATRLTRTAEYMELKMAQGGVVYGFQLNEISMHYYLGGLK